MAIKKKRKKEKGIIYSLNIHFCAHGDKGEMKKKKRKKKKKMI